VGVFAVLLAALAALQYRWIGEVSRAESERLRQRLYRSTRSLSEELDRELGRILFSFAAERAAGGSPESQVADWYELWRAGALYPDLVRDVWLPAPEGVGVRRFDPETGSVVETVWPPELRDALQPGRRPRSLMLPDVPALLVPRIDRTRGPRPGGRWRFGRLQAVVRLDGRVLREEILGDLVERHFGAADEREVDVAVVDRRTGSLIWPPGNELDASALLPGDLNADLLEAGPFGPQRGRGRRRFAIGPPSGSPQPPDAGPPPEPEAGAGHWQLVVRHRTGSLAAAVRSARRRNLLVSVGILGTLGVSGALILLSARRAERLARQQMEFVAGVTHELHTPLAAICSAGQNLADGVVKEPEQVRRYGSVIHKEGTRLSSTVGQILDFSGIQAGGRVYRSEPVAIGDVAEAALADNALAIREAGMTAELDMAEGLPEIAGDAAALRRALGNLIGNAVKFAASGGWLRVATGLDDSGNELQVRVEDRGPGISGDDRRRLFEPFYRGEHAEAARVRGSGLGLSIVAHIAQGHGGRTSVQARPEGGAAFVIHLPIGRGGRA